MRIVASRSSLRIDDSEIRFPIGLHEFDRLLGSERRLVASKFNESFVWDRLGLRVIQEDGAVHALDVTVVLPTEKDAWEPTWVFPGSLEFDGKAVTATTKPDELATSGSVRRSSGTYVYEGTISAYVTPTTAKENVRIQSVQFHD